MESPLEVMENKLDKLHEQTEEDRNALLEKENMNGSAKKENSAFEALEKIEDVDNITTQTEESIPGESNEADRLYELMRGFYGDKQFTIKDLFDNADMEYDQMQTEDRAYYENMLTELVSRGDLEKNGETYRVMSEEKKNLRPVTTPVVKSFSENQSEQISPDQIKDIADDIERKSASEPVVQAEAEILAEEKKEEVIVPENPLMEAYKAIDEGRFITAVSFIPQIEEDEKRHELISVIGDRLLRENNVDGVLAFCKQIQNEDVRDDILTGIIGHLVEENDFVSAERCLSGITSEERKNKVSQFIKEEKENTLAEKKEEGQIVPENTVDAENGQPQVEEQNEEEKILEDEVKEETKTIAEPPPLPPSPPPLPAEYQIESLGVIEEELRDTRTKYVKSLVEWKKANRERKGKFARLMSDLGVERQMPQLPQSPGLFYAEQAYREAKKKKMLFIQDKGNLKIGEVVTTVKKNLIEEIEHEQLMIEKLVDAGTTPTEKGRLRHMLDKVNKLPLPARMAITSVLLGTAGLAFGGLGLAGAATYAGYRTIRSATSTVAGMGAGKYVDSVFKKKNKEKREEAFNQYLDNLEHNFDLKERELQTFFTKEERRKRYQKTLKIGTVIGVAGITNYGMGYGFSKAGITHDLGIAENIKHKVQAMFEPTAPKVVHGVSVPIAPGASVHEMTHTTPHVTADAEVAQKVVPVPEIEPKASVPDVKVADVELSSRGFIDTIEKMQKQLHHLYPNNADVPTQYQHFVTTSPDKLAQEFGFYDPEHHLSGMGLKHEHLALDDKGKLLYTDTHGKEIGIGKTHGYTFADKFGKDRMFVSKPAPVVAHGIASAPEHPVVAQNTDVHTEPVIDQQPEAPNQSMSPRVLSEHIEPISTDYPIAETFPVDKEGIIIGGQPALIPENFGATNTAISQLELRGIISPASLEKVAHIVGHGHFDHGTAHLEFLDNGDTRNVVVTGLVNGMPTGQPIAVAQEVALGDKATVLALNDTFQANPFKELRRAFSQVLDKNITDMEHAGSIDVVKEIPFDGGKIHIVHEVGGNISNKYDVLLNGKKIAEGTAGHGQSLIRMLDDVPVHKHWWQGPTVFERALENGKVQSTLRELRKFTKATNVV